MAKKRFTRRDFIKTAAAGAFTAGLGAPLILPGRVSRRRREEDV